MNPKVALLLIFVGFIPTNAAAGQSEAPDARPLAVTDASALNDAPPPPLPPAVITRDSQRRATVRAIRLDEPLHLDGVLNETVYHAVPPFSDFIQSLPNEG